MNCVPGVGISASAHRLDLHFLERAVVVVEAGAARVLAGIHAINRRLVAARRRPVVGVSLLRAEAAVPPTSAPDTRRPGARFITCHMLRDVGSASSASLPRFVLTEVVRMSTTAEIALTVSDYLRPPTPIDSFTVATKPVSSRMLRLIVANPANSNATSNVPAGSAANR